jgi:predicted dehydrogenase
VEAVVAQVGLGPWGGNLARNFNELARLKWLCDVDPSRIDPLRARFPSTVLTDRLDDALEDPEVDAVVIATPVPTHAELAKRALRMRKHVLVEKPMALTGGESSCRATSSSTTPASQS